MNVQGTKMYVTDVPATAWADCAAAKTALKAGKQVTCVQSYGELSRSRDIKEYSCQDSNESDAAGGKMKYGDFALDLLLDPDNKDGQKALFDAMESNTPIVAGFESPTGSIVWSKAIVSGDTIGLPDGGKYTYKINLFPYGGFNRCPAKP